jgi:hypothetical protein
LPFDHAQANAHRCGQHPDPDPSSHHPSFNRPNLHAKWKDDAGGREFTSYRPYISIRHNHEYFAGILA